MAFSGKHSCRGGDRFRRSMALSAACCSGNGSARPPQVPTAPTSPSRRISKLTIATGDPAYEPWVMNDKPNPAKAMSCRGPPWPRRWLQEVRRGMDPHHFDTAIAPGAKDGT